MSKSSPKAGKPLRQTTGGKITSLLQRKTGATVNDLAKATGWQEHSIQGFMSGTLKKKHGLTITSSKAESQARRYFIAEKAQ